jgi:hypothetical protein
MQETPGEAEPTPVSLRYRDLLFGVQKTVDVVFGRAGRPWHVISALYDRVVSGY